jgi:hypothetical protein
MANPGLRKSVSEISKRDLDDCPMWEFASDDAKCCFGWESSTPKPSHVRHAFSSFLRDHGGRVRLADQIPPYHVPRLFLYRSLRSVTTIRERYFVFL